MENISAKFRKIPCSGQTIEGKCSALSSAKNAARFPILSVSAPLPPGWRQPARRVEPESNKRIVKNWNNAKTGQDNELPDMIGFALKSRRNSVQSGGIFRGKHGARLGVCISVAFALIAALQVCGLGYSGTVQAEAQAISGDTASSSLIPERSRKEAPALQIKGIDGKLIDLAQYRGEVVLLDFWAVHCGGCKLEIPWYVQFDQEYHRDGLQLIGIDMYGENPSLIRPFMAAAHMTYPVAVGTDAIGQRFHVGEMPLTLLIDRQGRIAYSHAGVVDKDSFERNVKALLR